MKKWLKKALFRHPTRTPLITVFLSQKALIHNLHFFQNKAGQSQVAPVLKSNAYGHGLVPIAEILDCEGLPFLIVDSFFEAHTLRHAGIKSPLLVIGYSRVEDMLSHHMKNVSFTITNLDTLRELSQSAHKNISIHLKIDTGMHRQGIMLSEKKEATEIIKKNPHLKLEGICSHLAEAGALEKTFTEKQIVEWNTLVPYFKKEFSTLKYWHLANTDGHFHTGIEANVTRLGIGLFGIHGPAELKPVMRIETIITSLRTIRAGETVGYDRTFVAQKDTAVATIPFGYYEGFDRRLSNVGSLKIGTTYCPIVGRVSMNITSIDVSEVPHAKVGDVVTPVSDVRSDLNSFEGIAEACGTISYEMVVRISPLLKRVVRE